MEGHARGVIGAMRCGMTVETAAPEEEAIVEIVLRYSGSECHAGVTGGRMALLAQQRRLPG